MFNHDGPYGGSHGTALSDLIRLAALYRLGDRRQEHSSGAWEFATRPVSSRSPGGGFFELRHMCESGECRPGGTAELR